MWGRQNTNTVIALTDENAELKSTIKVLAEELLTSRIEATTAVMTFLLTQPMETPEQIALFAAEFAKAVAATRPEFDTALIPSV